MKNHNDFILSQITDILKDVVSASVGIGSGIETYPLYDYIMQSVFLKMTGFQEQKMKCICWELATNDYEYRRVLLINEDKLGEYSSYPAKNKIYQQLIKQIKKYNSDFIVSSAIDNKNIVKKMILEIVEIFSNTNLSIWAQNDFNEFRNNKTLIQYKHFANNGTSLFENVLQDIYKFIYNHRNRCAHNTHSYQQNLPTLKTMANENYKYENYFVRFAILILIDKVFIELYNKYLNVLADGL